MKKKQHPKQRRSKWTTDEMLRDLVLAVTGFFTAWGMMAFPNPTPVLGVGFVAWLLISAGWRVK